MFQPYKKVCKHVTPSSFVACQRQWLVDLPVQKRDVSRAIIIDLARCPQTRAQAHRTGSQAQDQRRRARGPKAYKILLGSLRYKSRACFRYMTPPTGNRQATNTWKVGKHCWYVSDSCCSHLGPSHDTKNDYDNDYCRVISTTLISFSGHGTMGAVTAKSHLTASCTGAGSGGRRGRRSCRSGGGRVVAYRRGRACDLAGFD